MIMLLYMYVQVTISQNQHHTSTRSRMQPYAVTNVYIHLSINTVNDFACCVHEIHSYRPKPPLVIPESQHNGVLLLSSEDVQRGRHLTPVDEPGDGGGRAPLDLTGELHRYTLDALNIAKLGGKRWGCVAKVLLRLKSCGREVTDETNTISHS